MGDVVDADEYLQPYKGLGNRDNQARAATVTKVFKSAITASFCPQSYTTFTVSCFCSSPQNGRPVRENSIALRYIADPTHNSLDKDDFTDHGTR